MNLRRLRELTESLAVIELEMAAFFDLCPDLLAIADSSGYFIKTNKHWTTVLGWSSEELQGKPWLYFVHPDDIDQTISIFSVMSSGNKITNFVNRYRCKNGDYVCISWNASELDDTKKAYCVGRVLD